MLFLKIIDKVGNIKFHAKSSYIREIYRGVFENGDKIYLRSDGDNIVAVKFDKTLKESLLYLSDRDFTFYIPSGNELQAGYAKGAFEGDSHEISAREVDDEEFYAVRNIALNSHDLRVKTGGFPHATANFVTREEPCFYERNAIDGVINNQGHGVYPYHSWAGGARDDLEFMLDFGREVAIDKLVFYLRADFVHDPITGLPHDSYWKNIDVEFSDGEIKTCEFKLHNEDLHPDNSKGTEINVGGKVTRTVKLFNFKQITEKLGFAALSQIEIYCKYIKENLDSNRNEVKS